MRWVRVLIRRSRSRSRRNSMGETAGKGSITPSPRPSAVRVTARSFHSEQQGQATSVQGNENICAEVAVYSSVSSVARNSNPYSHAIGTPMDSTVHEDPRDTAFIDRGAPWPTITNGDLLAWL